VDNWATSTSGRRQTVRSRPTTSHSGNKRLQDNLVSFSPPFLSQHMSQERRGGPGAGAGAPSPAANIDSAPAGAEAMEARPSVSFKQMARPVVSVSSPLACRSVVPLFVLLVPVLFWYSAKPQYRCVDVPELCAYVVVCCACRRRSAMPRILSRGWLTRASCVYPLWLIEPDRPCLVPKSKAQRFAF
jgi:hypothetical protein